MAESLLRAIDLPELVAENGEGFEAIAIALARDPARLAGLRARLAANRTTAPLFDSARFTRNLEAAYSAMWQRHLDGALPASFAV